MTTFLDSMALKEGDTLFSLYRPGKGMESGDHRIPIDAANLQSGAYTLLAHVNGTTISRKMIIAR